ncbi:MAG: hypothetical protein NVS4B11_05290 [Ktedonobacteraceae bacterium]
MNLEYLENVGDSLSKLLKELRQTFQAWSNEDRKALQKKERVATSYSSKYNMLQYF